MIRECRWKTPGEHKVRGGDDVAGVEHLRDVDEAAIRVQVLSDEYPVRAQTTFSHERIRPGQRGLRSVRLGAGALIPGRTILGAAAGFFVPLSMSILTRIFAGQ